MVDSQIEHKISHFVYPFSIGNRMLCYKKMYSLLLKLLITFLRYMSGMEGLADSIYKPLLYQTMLYLPHNIYSQIAFQLLDLGRVRYPLIGQNGMQWCGEWHPLILKWLLTFSRCIRKMEGTTDSIYTPCIVHALHFLLWPALKLHKTFQIWSILSSKELGCCATRSDIYCCWSVS